MPAATLHIIGGSLRGRALKSPRSQTRPTLAITRKAVFDILRPHIDGASFLDLFAGSGAMGLEALSQGASHATFIDSSKESIRCIRENIQTLQLEDSTAVFQADVQTALKKLKKPFDIVYIDPPYADAALLTPILKTLDQSSILTDSAIVLVEEGYPSRLNLDKLALTTLRHKDARHFGKSLLHQYRKKAT